MLELALVADATAQLLGRSALATSARPWRPSSGSTEVLFAVVLAWALLGELPRGVQLLGGVLPARGVAAVRLPRERSARPRPEELGADAAPVGVASVPGASEGAPTLGAR